ncbi:Glycosyltransferase involved in cell wall bisynthesis [Algoriphagus alkaliphilus]|uniref:Glycosyltransferase involved in cell wall bisynthesis n=1 Tax=Algoriphagus alkaliphilus TaxID=279824 RepID=A0A1G5Y662_9BACT|nr:glycosyltransferase family 1 protein [Algoriphagus alkaliphilus]SDA78191.1 Glycosyltransferase involved in cell wall bisynthesis [Algoriphagus alkaliphilus]
MKVLHLPTTVGGNPQGISKHLRILGVDSQTWALRQNYLGYPVDKVIWKDSDNFFQREWKRLKALAYVFQDWDAIHFNFGTTLFIQEPYIPTSSLARNLFRKFYAGYLDLMQGIELRVLKWRKIPLFVQYQGDDARQGDFCLRNFKITAATQVGSEYYNERTDSQKRIQIERMARFCFKVYGLNPDLLYVLPLGAEFLPYSHISFEEWKPHYTQLQNRPLRIGHAPSNRKGKGTDFVIAALEELKSEGYQFEFVLIEGVSNAEAKLIYQDIDVLVDQLFFGWYGGLAVEAMALGKPVLVYLREEDLYYIPNKMKEELPFINVHSESIKAGLKSVLELPRQDLFELAKKSRDFVLKWHDPIAIANRLVEDYKLGKLEKEK